MPAAAALNSRLMKERDEPRRSRGWLFGPGDPPEFLALDHDPVDRSDHQTPTVKKEAPMSRKLVLILGATVILGFVAIASTIVRPGLGAAPGDQVSLSRVDFDATFAAFDGAPSLDPEHAAADREKLRQFGLKRMNAFGR
jgi:hypothetical protein